MRIRHFFDRETSTLSYLVWDEAERIGVVIDPVLDFDPRSGRTATRSADEIARAIDAEGLRVPFVLDTHAHADHLTALPYFRERCGAQTGIGARIAVVQETFRAIYDLPPDFRADGSQFDVLLSDGDVIEAGPLRIEALHTPGHTPACLTYRISDALFVGDVLFMPDYGTARCDFPGGSADVLYDSVQRLYRLPGELRVFTGHDYQPGGRPLRFESSVAEERAENVQLQRSTTREQFVAFRRTRDAQLALPHLMLPAVQVNVRAGALPAPAANGVSYLKIPVNLL